MIDAPLANAVRVTPAEDLLALTAALVAVPSVSTSEGALAELVAERLADRASALTITQIGDNVVAHTQLGCAERVLYGGHLDTVPPSGNAEPRIEGDVLHGIGSADMKGGLAVMLRLAEAVSDGITTGNPPTRDLTLVFYACEEIQPEASGLLAIHGTDPALLYADFAVLLEPTEGWIEAGCQGAVNVAVTVVGRRAHSARPWMGDNAIHTAGRIVARIAESDPGTVEVDGLAFHQSRQVVQVSGGIANNVVPDECIVTVNRRIAPGLTVEDVLAEVRALAPEAESVDLINAAPPAPPNLADPLVAEFVAASGAQVRPKLGWTDVARFTEMGVPALNFGPGDPTKAHGPNEQVHRSELDAVYNALFAFLG